MAKVKLSLKDLSIPQKIQLARQIVIKMTGNGNFTTPVPALADITNKVNASETAFNDAANARQTSQQKTTVQDTQEDVLDTALTQLTAYVESASAGDEAKILSAGMDVRAAAAPVGPMPQVEGLDVTAGDMEGAVDLQWEPVRGAKSYQIQSSAQSGTGPWTNGPVATKSQATISGQTSGTRCWFRVAAIGSAGPGPWSDPATKIVP